MKQLVPAAEQLSPTLISIAELAPEAKAFFGSLEKVNALAPTGFPALRKLFRDEFPPLLRALEPVPAEPQPDPRPASISTKPDVAGAFANLAATFHGELPTVDKNGEPPPLPAGDRADQRGNPLHLRQPLGDQPQQRLQRPELGGTAEVRRAPRLRHRAVLGRASATLEPNTRENPVFKERVKLLEPEAGIVRTPLEETTKLNEELDRFYNGLRQYAFGGGHRRRNLRRPPASSRASSSRSMATVPRPPTSTRSNSAASPKQGDELARRLEIVAE